MQYVRSLFGITSIEKVIFDQERRKNDEQMNNKFIMQDHLNPFYSSRIFQNQR